MVGEIKVTRRRYWSGVMGKKIMGWQSWQTLDDDDDDGGESDDAMAIMGGRMIMLLLGGQQIDFPNIYSREPMEMESWSHNSQHEGAALAQMPSDWNGSVVVVIAIIIMGSAG